MDDANRTNLKNVDVSNGKHNITDIRKHLLLRIIWWFSWVVCLAGISSSVINLLLITSVQMEFPERILRCHGVVLGALVTLAESGRAQVFRLVGILESWVFRGLFLTFVAALLLVFDDRSLNKMFEMFRHLTSYTLLVCGALYCLGGAFCIRQIHSKQLWSIQKKTALHKEKEYLQKRKVEIEKLLGDTEVKLQYL
mmetsp:Transcript_33789/g.44573  ORF Transcript_33789/g.44573 Transcript_33789/m.44573 type:complete len:196 (+) Transcript_33789:225-812(+)